MIRVRLVLTAVAGFVSLSSPVLAADANCPSATTPICRKYSCTGPLIGGTCTCTRWECAVVKDPSKGDKVMQSFPAIRRPNAARF